MIIPTGKCCSWDAKKYKWGFGSDRKPSPRSSGYGSVKVAILG